MSNSIQFILIIRFSALGDLILLSPLFREAKKLYPHAHIDFLTSEQYKELHQTNPYINTIYSFNKASQKSMDQLIHTLKQNKYNLILDAHNSIRSNSITRKLASRLKRKNQVEVRRLQRFLFRRILQVNFHLLLNKPLPSRRETNIALLQTTTLLNSYTELFPTKQDENNVKKRLVSNNKPIIAICPGAAHVSKCWSEKYFIILINKLAQAGYQIYLVGSKQDKQTFRIYEQTQSVSINLAGELPILETATLLQKALLTIGNDSATAHCSEAVGTPCFTFFGPTKNMGFNPFLPLSHILSLDLPCRPCSRHGKTNCKLKKTNKYACLMQIEPETVFQTVLTWHNKNKLNLQN